MRNITSHRIALHRRRLGVKRAQVSGPEVISLPRQVGVAVAGCEGEGVAVGVAVAVGEGEGEGVGVMRASKARM